MIEYRDDGIGYAMGDWGEAMADDGTMLKSFESLKEAIVGHRIVKVDRSPTPVKDEEFWWRDSVPAVGLLLDDGSTVKLVEEGDCCAYTELKDIIEHLPTIEHIITDVVHDGDFESWYILADGQQVLELSVAWSCGNPFYYPYGFWVHVERGAQ